jgi:hypothetical protein
VRLFLCDLPHALPVSSVGLGWSTLRSRRASCSASAESNALRTLGGSDGEGGETMASRTSVSRGVNRNDFNAHSSAYWEHDEKSKAQISVRRSSWSLILLRLLRFQPALIQLSSFSSVATRKSPSKTRWSR